MTEHLKLAFSEDIDIRTHGLEHEDVAGLCVNVHEISAGPVYRDARISVPRHRCAAWLVAAGFRLRR